MVLKAAASMVAILLVATPLVAQPAPEPPVKGPPAKGPPPGPGEKAPPPRWEGPAKGAHFKLKRGGDNIDVKCADDEPVKACVDATASLIDRVWGRK